MGITGVTDGDRKRRRAGRGIQGADRNTDKETNTADRQTDSQTGKHRMDGRGVWVEGGGEAYSQRLTETKLEKRLGL